MSRREVAMFLEFTNESWESKREIERKKGERSGTGGRIVAKTGVASIVADRRNNHNSLEV